MIPRSAWTAIDAVINRATKSHNAGVPPVGHEKATAFAVEKDRFTGRLEVTAVRFVTGEVRLRTGKNERWQVTK